MTVRRTMLRAGTFVMALQCAVPLVGAEPKAFAPAFYDPGKGLNGSTSLHVFPLDAPKFVLPLPFKPGAFAVTPDGSALYATQLFGPLGLYKIEFGPTREARVAGSEVLGATVSLAASSVKIVASAGYPNYGGLVTQCGLYELTFSTGDVRQIMGN